MPSNDKAENSDRPLLLTAIVLAGVMFVFPLTVSFPLLDPDEGLHASISQEMVERGQWIAPTLLGRPFLDKPILFFWAQAAALQLLGPSEAALRLPGLMFGLLGAITTGLLAWRLFDRRTGLMAGILYATTILPTALAQAASHDVALIPCVNLTLLMFWEAERAASRRVDSACSLGAGLFLGLAILTKGLSGVAVVGLAYGSYLLITRRISLAILLRGAVVLGIAGLVASPWYYLMAQECPGYLRYYFVERHIMGFITESQPHGDQPWWYYLPFLLGGGLPWIGYLPIVVQEGLARRGNTVGAATVGAAVVGAAVVLPHQERSDSTTAAPTLARRGNAGIPSPSVSGAMPLLWSWLIGWTILMTLAGSKLATYLWPVFPPMAILAATAWRGLIDGALADATRRSFARTFTFSSWTGPIVLPAAVLVVQVVYDVRFARPVWAAVGIMALLTMAPLIFWRAGRWQASLTAAALSMAGQFIVVMTLVLPSVAETCSARQLAEHFNRQGRMPSRLLLVEGRIGSLVYYLDPQIRAGLTPDRIQPTLAKELPNFRSGDVLVVQEWKVPKLQKHFDADRHQYESFGSYRLYDDFR